VTHHGSQNEHPNLNTTIYTHVVDKLLGFDRDRGGRGLRGEGEGEGEGEGGEVPGYP
jgi:hypothetical protein